MYPTPQHTLCRKSEAPPSMIRAPLRYAVKALPSLFSLGRNLYGSSFTVTLKTRRTAFAVSRHLLDKTTACPGLKPIASAFMPDPKDTPEKIRYF